MTGLTTHILDTAHGRPAAGVAIRLFRTHPERTLLGRFVSNQDGRCDEPLLQGDAFTAGEYELEFAIGDYFKTEGTRFLDQVVIRFGVSDPAQHYHVPLLVSPFGYTTYRGS